MIALVSDKRQSLKEFTENNHAQAAFFFNTLLRNREIKVNGNRVNKDMVLSQGDIVSYYLTEKQLQKPAFYIVYEDENILVADKESGVNSEAVFAALQRERECYFIHRLDRNTKGLLVFALRNRAEEAMLAAFQERKAEKKYHALCFGDFKKDRETLTAYLKKDAEKALVKVFDAPKAGAEKIVTEYAVLERRGELTKVEVTLHTGKTHQIRAHLAHIGCPIVGDMKYGYEEGNREKKVARQCLVAKSLQLFLDDEFAYLREKKFVSRFDAELPIL